MIGRACHLRARRGIALLIVLAAVVGVATAGLLIARTAVLDRSADRLRARHALAGDALKAAEGPIRAWLERAAPHAVLPPEATSPRLTVLADTWTATGAPADEPVACALTITAWDQLGMVSWRALGANPLIDGALPETDRRLARAALDQTDGSAPLGLDLLPARAHAGRIFPRREEATSDAQDRPALGALIAPHNPPRSGRNANPRWRLNVNTAPVPLLEAAFDALGRGGLEAITAARARREQAPIGTTERRRGRDLGRGVPDLAARSNVWSVRIDARAGRVRRSWWETWASAGSRWRRIQRLEITE